MITIVGKEDVGDTLVVGDTYLDILYDATEQKGGLYETTDEGSIKVACFENRKQVELFENTMVRAIREYTDKVLKGETIEGRPKGEWKPLPWKRILDRDIRLMFPYKCDNCDKEIRVEHIDGYNYCPNCGAEMENV